MNEDQFGKLIEKIEAAKKGAGVDLSKDEDLAIAVMNLISLEEHFFFTRQKTGKDEYLDLLKETREALKFFLGKMIQKHEGETWCISKHLLSTAMRLIEVGTKLKNDGKDKEAKETFDYAYKMWGMFWGLRLKLVEIEDIKKEGEDEKPWTLKDIVSKLVNCCDE